MRERDNQYRLAVWQMLSAGCKHLFSKSKLQIEKFNQMMPTLYQAAQEDNLFIAKLAAWAADREKNEDRDILLLALYANALNWLHGQPVSPGSSVRYPNLRVVSHQLLSQLNPKYLFRLIGFNYLKWSVNGGPEATHFPGSLEKAIKNYLLNTPIWVYERHVQAGFKRWIRRSFQAMHISPDQYHDPDRLYSVLNWKPKNRDLIRKREILDLSKLTELQVIEKIREEKIRFPRVLSALGKEPSPAILAVLLEEELVTPNEAVINQALFRNSGLFLNEKYKNMYFDLIQRMTVADRVDTLVKELPEEEKQVIQKARSAARKREGGLSKFGNIVLAIDASPSMSQAIEFAKDIASTVADFADNEEAFKWCTFDTRLHPIKGFPQTKEHAKAILSMYHCGGYGTNCFAPIKTYNNWASVIIVITDGQHNSATPLELRDQRKPPIVIVRTEGYNRTFERRLDDLGFHYTVVDSSAFQQKALIRQTLEAAIRGQMAVIEDIMSYDLTPYGIEI